MLDKALKLMQDIQDESVSRKYIETQISELLEELDDAGYTPSEQIQTLIYNLVEEVDFKRDYPREFEVPLTGFLTTLAAWVMIKRVS